MALYSTALAIYGLANQRDTAIAATREWATHAAKLERRIRTLEEENARLRGQLENGSFQLHEIHPEIRKVVESPLEHGFYEDAVRRAMIALELSIRAKSGLDRSLVGVSLVGAAIGGDPPRVKFSDHPGEQQGARALFQGAMGFFRNSIMHGFPEEADPRAAAWETVAFASRLLHLLENAEA